MYSLKELALVSSYFAQVDFAHKFRVFVYQPRLTQHVRSRVLQLSIHHHHHRHKYY